MFLDAVAELPAQAMLVANAIQVSVISDPFEVHEGHDGPGARESVDATAQIGRIPEIVQCGFLFPQLTGDLVSLGGPFGGVELTWAISPEAQDHGTLDVGGGAGVETTITDRSGRSHVSFDTRQEPSKGKGDERDLTATVFVTADVRPALLAAGVSRALVDLVPSPVPVRGTATFRISWHDDAQHWTGTMTSSANETVTGDNIGLVCSGTWTTRAVVDHRNGRQHHWNRRRRHRRSTGVSGHPIHHANGDVQCPDHRHCHRHRAPLPTRYPLVLRTGRFGRFHRSDGNDLWRRPLGHHVHGSDHFARPCPRRATVAIRRRRIGKIHIRERLRPRLRDLLNHRPVDPLLVVTVVGVAMDSRRNARAEAAIQMCVVVRPMRWNEPVGSPLEARTSDIPELRPAATPNLASPRWPRWSMG